MHKETHSAGKFARWRIRVTAAETGAEDDGAERIVPLGSEMDMGDMRAMVQS